jgi:hypothetical protein
MSAPTAECLVQLSRISANAETLSACPQMRGSEAWPWSADCHPAWKQIGRNSPYLFFGVLGRTRCQAEGSEKRCA